MRELILSRHLQPTKDETMAKKLGDTGKTTKTDEAERLADISGNVTQETFLQSCQELAAVNAEAKAINEKRKKVRKTIKARGIELGDLDATLKKADWAPEEVTAHFERRNKYADWLGLPRGIQADLFKDMTPADREQAIWHGRGVTAGRAGKSATPPEECPDSAREAFVRGFKGKALKPDKKGPKLTPEEEAAFDKAEAATRARPPAPGNDLPSDAFN